MEIRQTLVGHGDAVTALACTPDGTQLISGDAASKVIVWELATGRQLAAFTAHTGQGRVEAIAIAPDGRSAAVSAGGREDGTMVLGIWDLAKQKRTQELGTDRRVQAVIFDRSGKRVFAGDHQGSISIFVGGKPSKTLSGHTRTLGALALSADESRLASAGHDHTVRVWDGKSGKQLHTLARHDDSVVTCAFSPDAAWLATGGMDRALYVWSLPGGEPQRLTGPKACVDAVAFTPDGEHVVSADGAGVVRVHAMASRKVVAQHAFRGRAKAFRHRLVMLADGTCCVARASGAIVRLAR